MAADHTPDAPLKPDTPQARSPLAPLSEVRGCRLVDLPEHTDPRGRLTVIEGGRQLGFRVERVFYVHGVPPHVARGLHAHRELNEFIVAVCGSFVVTVDDGTSRALVRLDRPGRALHIEPHLWTEFTEFSADAICLVLASAPYDPADYLYDYAEFEEFVRAVRP